MDVRSCPVLLLLFLLAVVMAMCQRIVVMLMRMPVGAVLPLVERIVRVVMSRVMVVVRGLERYACAPAGVPLPLSTAA